MNADLHIAEDMTHTGKCSLLVLGESETGEGPGQSPGSAAQTPSAARTGTRGRQSICLVEAESVRSATGCRAQWRSCLGQAS